MIDADLRLVQCEGKEAFTSPQVAAKVAMRRTASKRRRGRLERPLQSYRCTSCGAFHIGGAS